MTHPAAWQEINTLFARGGLPEPPTKLRDELVSHLRLAREWIVEKERASILLEAAWEAVAELGPTDSTAERFLIPAILKTDGDPEYAREQLVFSAANPAENSLSGRQGNTSAGNPATDAKPNPPPPHPIGNGNE